MTHITKTSPAGVELIKEFEAFRSKPYLDRKSGVPTIGYGATYYPNGLRVTLNDPPITMEVATKMLSDMLPHYELEVDSCTTDLINQNQFDALVSFAYNVGASALKRSTLLKRINANVNDPSIKAQFLRWNMDEGEVNPGLTRRRKREAELYFTPVLNEHLV